MTHGSGQRSVVSAGKLTGMRVRNQVGEDLGTIEELMIDVPSGRVAYAIIAFGGLLGVGDKLFPAPWRALILNERTREFLLDVDRKQFEQAPGIDPNRWPDMNDPMWDSQVEEFYGVRQREPAGY